MESVEQAQRALRWLVPVRWVAVADLVLLIILLGVSFADNDPLVSVFGLVHGIVFLVLLAIIAAGSMEKLWSWWFLAGTLVTTGPPGAFIGEVIIARRARATLAEGYAGPAFRGEGLPQGGTDGDR